MPAFFIPHQTVPAKALFLADMTFTSTLEYFEHNAVYGHHIPVPAGMISHIISDDKRVLCTLNGDITLHSALMPDGKGGFYILINKEVRSKTGLVRGQEVTVELAPDTSRYGMDMPAELEELLAQEEEGDRLFHALTPGKQRSLIHWVSTVKSPEKRLKRALVMLRHLTGHKGKLDWKKLNEELKAANH